MILSIEELGIESFRVFSPYGGRVPSNCAGIFSCREGAEAAIRWARIHEAERIEKQEDGRENENQRK